MTFKPLAGTLALGGALLISACQQNGAAPAGSAGDAALDTDAQKFSYSAGYEIGSRLGQMGEVDVDLSATGETAAAAGPTAARTREPELVDGGPGGPAGGCGTGGMRAPLLLATRPPTWTGVGAANRERLASGNVLSTD